MADNRKKLVETIVTSMDIELYTKERYDELLDYHGKMLNELEAQKKLTQIYIDKYRTIFNDIEKLRKKNIKFRKNIKILRKILRALI